MTPRTLISSLIALTSAALLSTLGACGGSGDTSSGDPSSTGTSSGTGGSGGEEPPPKPKRRTITGDVTWNVTFDDTAKMAGAFDCSYTRHYVGVEDASAPWLCPSCEVMYKADVTMTAGQADCFTQLSSTPPAEVEWIGYVGGAYWRGSGLPMAEQGTATFDQAQTTLTTANNVMGVDAPVGGTATFDVAGTLTIGEEEGDIYNGFKPPETYACGWPKANPTEYTGDFTIAKGQMMPDGVFLDKCNEPVRLHDFKGKYLIVDMSAINCPPCQLMATDEEQFITDMAAMGVEVVMITLLAPSLEDPLGVTSQAKLNSWTTKYNLTSPVLGDRAWGLSMFIPLFADQTGYPSWVVVDPNLNVVDFGSGFGTFDDFKTIIQNNMP